MTSKADADSRAEDPMLNSIFGRSGTGTQSPHQPSPWWHKIRQPLRRLSRSTQFVIAATVILGLTMAFVGNLVSKTIERSAVQTAANVVGLYMTTFLEPYVQELTTADRLSVASAGAIDRLMTSPTLTEHVVSVKIWAPDGTILYATNKDMIGKRYAAEDLTQALQGNTVTEWGALDAEENRYERSLGIPLYEIYAPLREFGTERIIAVGEFYEKAEMLEQEIAVIRQEVWIVVGTATLSMLLLLFAIVRRGERIILRQELALSRQMQEQARLNNQNINLQRKITSANQSFSRVNELILRRLGADLHDGPAQLLTLILVRLDELAVLQERYRENGGEFEMDALESLRHAAKDALGEIRDISRGLALPEINGMPLGQELELVVQRHELRTETQVKLSCSDLPEKVPLAHKTCIYRFVQEALNNAYHHADGEGQEVSATFVQGVLEVRVSDSGDGFDVEHPVLVKHHERARLGLAGMRYRVESLGGQFNVISNPNDGTTVSAKFRL
ncbi:sensor histidine kinase [Pseudomonas benzenivorans]|uniref:histidine kinase n=1 Tax=Pseudomonas benzenivorans TaxID=556533 RepID=A0ABY5H9G0_9PSED|nr:sensor histidine kinase [Pseudomonas benzenivorans]UTW08482.1 sensor histidine kinase [Pseudomonas benzenivorans]